jgi:hypothetical protein
VARRIGLVEESPDSGFAGTQGIRDQGMRHDGQAALVVDLGDGVPHPAPGLDASLEE